MQVRHATHPDQVAGFDTDDLRRHYLVTDLFRNGAVTTVYSQHDRMVIGGVRPQAGRPVRLETADPLRAAYFLERREAGVVNVGTDPGTVTVDDIAYPMAPCECLYIGRGARDVVFEGRDTAAFYLVSAPAHTAHPTRLAGLDEAAPLRLGSPAGSNDRTIYKYIHLDGIASAQLVLGVTVLEPGSMWNTMPCHRHDRRTEVYLYFGLGAADRVVHVMGEPHRTRNLLVADGEAVISPPWSVHCGLGTGAYAFVWAMAGENQDYADVDPVAVTELR
jgi:4-deoxy-L-threo-5-hexosulose-uronate ketol-isomerase